MAYLILVRHGQSEWNVLNKCTGFMDVELTEKGCTEASRAAALIRDVTLHKAYSSDLTRAQHTLDIILNETNHAHIPRTAHHALKERHYGDFTGKNKDEIKKEFGEAEFQKVRRGWDTPPPNGESLKDTHMRVVPFYEEHILNDLKQGHNVLVSAHGNSLRALIKHLEQLSDSDVEHLEIGTGVLHVYEVKDDGTIVSKEIRDHNTTP